MTGAAHFWMLAAVAGLAVTTVVTRGFFLFTPSSFVLPRLVQRALKYAPTAAIVAVITPDILMQGGQVDLSWHNKALIATLVASVVFVWRQSLLLMIAVGMLVYTALRLGFGW